MSAALGPTTLELEERIDALAEPLQRFDHRLRDVENLGAGDSIAPLSAAAAGEGCIPNAKTTFGAKGDGVTDDTAAIQAAVNSGFCWVPPGTYLVGKITIPSFTNLWGAGIDKTFFKLKAGTKDSLFETTNYIALVEGGAGLGPRQIAIRDMTLDGNKAENAAPAANKGHGIAFDAYGFRVENVHIRNCARDGWTSQASHEEEAASGPEKVEGSYESVIRNVRTYHNEHNGFTFFGPSSSFLSDIMSYNNGEEGTGIQAGGTTSYWVNCRSWGFQKYAWFVEGHEQMVNCSAEEGRLVTLYLHGGLAHWVGGFIFNQGVAVEALIKIGAAGAEVGETQLEGFRAAYTGAGVGVSLDLENDSGNSTITGEIHHVPAHPATKGTPKKNSKINLTIQGGTTTASFSQLGKEWAAIPGLAAGLANRAGREPNGYRNEGDRLFLRGQLEAAAGKEVAAGATIGTLPETSWPKAIIEIPCLIAAGAAALIISAAGVITSNLAIKEGQALKLDGIDFNIT